MRQCSIFSTVDVAFEDQDAVVTTKILRLFTQTEIFGVKKRRHRLFLVETDFQAYHAICLKMMTSLRSDGAIGIKPVYSAIKRCGRVVKSHLRLKLMNDTGPDIRRI